MKVVTLAQRPEFAGQASGAVQAPLPQWRAWTGLAFDHDGEVIVPGALAPVLVSTRRDIGAYGEPNVWALHDLADDDREPCRGRSGLDDERVSGGA